MHNEHELLVISCHSSEASANKVADELNKEAFNQKAKWLVNTYRYSESTAREIASREYNKYFVQEHELEQ
jgi:hypothetical protein